MKIQLVSGIIACTVCALAEAALFQYEFVVNTPVPDNDPSGLVLWQDINASTLTSDGRTMGSEYSGMSDVRVTLTVRGGYNGDLYSYLVHSGGFAVLLNRVGRGTTGAEPVNSFGYGDNGFNNIRFSASAERDIHLYGGGFLPSGDWQPDGRNVDPDDVMGDSARTAGLGAFSSLSMTPHGRWTIFFADMSAGQQSTIERWGLEIEAVPEPVTIALGIFGAVFLVAVLGRTARVRKLLGLHVQPLPPKEAGELPERGG